MEAALIVVALLFVLCVVAGLYATVRVVRAAKRGVDRTVSQARRTVENSTLKAKSVAQPGPLGELASLRLSLRTSMRATQDTLAANSVQDTTLSESLGLFDRLSVHGHELDDELKRLERDPDRPGLAAKLPFLRERTGRIVRSAEALRWAARDRAARFSDDDLDDLSRQIDLEAGALRHWTSAAEHDEAAPQAGAGVPGAAGGRDTTPHTTWPEPPAGPRRAAEQRWPEAPGPAGADTPPPEHGRTSASPASQLWDRLLKEPRREPRPRG